MMKSSEKVALMREIQAAIIPNGSKITLPKGQFLHITQALGGSFTCITQNGYMVSIAGKDADALGKEIPKQVAQENAEGKSVEELVWDQLKTCYDPEIPHNIVDLGLVYECRLEPADEGQNIFVKMTLTAPGCGMGDWLKQDARSKILQIPGVKNAQVDVVFDPPWNPGMMNKALRRAMNM